MSRSVKLDTESLRERQARAQEADRISHDDPTNDERDVTVIPDEAVEAAAAAQYEARYGIGKWASCPFPDVWRGMVRPGLEAAAPHMLAAWIEKQYESYALPGYGPKGWVKPAPIYQLGKIEDKRR